MVPNKLYPYIAGIVIVLCGYLSLANLGNASLWDDESYTAIAARNYNQTGQLVSWDGRNLLGFRNGCMVDSTLAFDNPPVEIMVAAQAFRWFGEESTMAARFFFALSGFIAFLLLGYTLWLDFKNSSEEKNIALLTFLLVGLTPTWWLYTRQAHYYPITGLLGLLAWFSYRKWVKKEQKNWILLLAISGILLFFTQYLIAAVTLAAIGLHCLIFRPAKSWDLIKSWQFWVAALAFLSTTVPYAIEHQIWHQNCLANTDSFGWKITELFLTHWREFSHANILPLIFLAIAIVAYFKKGIPAISKEWVSFGLIYLGILIIVSPQPTSASVEADIRYALPVFPMFFMVTAFAMLYLVKRIQLATKGHWLGNLTVAAIILISTFTSLTQLFPDNPKLRLLMPAHLREVSNDYPDAYSLVGNFLEKNAQSNDLVLTLPDFNNYPLQFYHGDKLYFGPILTETAFCGPNLLEKLPQRLRISKTSPDWLVCFGELGVDSVLFNKLTRTIHNDSIPQPPYELVETISVCWKDMAPQRPELYHHEFEPASDCGKKERYLRIYKKVK